MKEILSLNHNGSELCLFRIDGKLKFVKKENNKLKTKLTREERVLLLNVVANLMPSNDITRLHDIKMDGKQMKHFFDKKRGWHLFYELNDSGFTLPTKDEQIRLNNMFNRQVTSIYSANNPKKDDKIKRIIRFGKTIAVVFVASAISFVANGCSKNEEIINDDSSYEIIYEEVRDLAEEQKQIIESDESYYDFEDTDYDYSSGLNFGISDGPAEEGIYFDEQLVVRNPEYQNLSTEEKVTLIMETINQNANLTKEEKEFFLSCPQFFIDGAEYFDIDYVINGMKNLKIIYVSEPIEGLEGEYISFGEEKNTIKLYGCSNFNDADKQTLSHEFLHAFTVYQGAEMAFGVGMAEIVNVMLNNEYFGTTYDDIVETEYFGELSVGVNPNEYDKSYHWSRRYGYLLTEIVGADVMRQFHATADPTVIEEALYEICVDEVAASNIIIGLDFHVWNYTWNLEDEMFAEIMADVEKDLEFYYEQKFGKQVSEDDYASYLMRNDEYAQKFAEEYNLELDNNSTLQFDVLKEKKFFNSQILDNNYEVGATIKTPYSVTYEELMEKHPEYLMKIAELPKDENGNYIIYETTQITTNLTNNTNYTR